MNAASPTSFFAAVEPTEAHPAESDPGFSLGWDFAHHGLVPPTEHLHPLSPLRQGWEAGRRVFAQRTLKADRFVAQWLALRLQAWRAGSAFEGIQVTPAFLRRIDASHCPVTREALRCGSGGDAEPVVVRLNEAAAYAAGNLVVVSKHAARSRAGRNAKELLTMSRLAEPGFGLDADAWQRWAVLASFAATLPREVLVPLPLHVLPTPRLRLVNPLQGLQTLLSLQFSGLGHARRCSGLAQMMPDAQTRYAFEAFMHTLLARRLSAGRIDDALAERHALEALWSDALVQRRWHRLAWLLSDEACETIVSRAIDQGLAGAAMQWLERPQCLDGWGLTADEAYSAESAPCPVPSPARSSRHERPALAHAAGRGRQPLAV